MDEPAIIAGAAEKMLRTLFGRIPSWSGSDSSRFKYARNRAARLHRPAMAQGLGFFRLLRDSTLHFRTPARFIREQSPELSNCFGRPFAGKESMLGRNKDKKHSLYYLLPGMTRANREKRRRVFWWSVVVGILASALVAGLIFLVNRGPQP